MPITKEDAETIASKLGAEDDPRKGRPHELKRIYVDGKLVASFGISRASQRNKGHGHIPKLLKISPAKTAELAACTYNLDDWVEDLKARSLI